MDTLEKRVQAALDRGIGYDTKQVIRDLVREIDRLQSGLMQIAGGDAYHDGAARFMEIARETLADKRTER